MVLDIVIVLIATAGIYFFSQTLSNGTDAIGTRFRINPGVRGATLDAVASSFPELSTVVVTLMMGKFDAGVGAVAGSALYNILVIPAVSVVVGGPLKIQKQVVRRDGFLYTFVVVGLVLAIWLGPEERGETVVHRLDWWEGLICVAVYIAYVVVLAMQARTRPSQPPPPQQQPKKGAERVIEELKDGEPKTPTEFKPWKVILQVVGGIAGIGIATHFLVHSGLNLFEQIGLSEAVAGVTLLAAATSLPDTLLSVFAVRRGDPDGAVANAFGSNSFDILICLGLPVLIVGGVAVNWIESWSILFFLLGSTVVSVFFLLTEWELTKREALIMGVIYVVFLVLALVGVVGG